MVSLKTAILPVAGSGTRMLPMTKAVAKELLPVYDTPLLQFAIDEAVAAGVERLVLVTHPDKHGIREYFGCTRALEEKLADKGKVGLLDELERAKVPSQVEVVFVDQESADGLGHAVLCARDHVLPGPVGVILPDDLIFGEPCLAAMGRAYDPARMNSLIAAEKVAREATSSYGIFDLEADGKGALLAARGFVEKPEPEDAPSTMAAVGRYIVPPAIFPTLEETAPGKGGEIQLTDAIAALGGIYAWVFEGTRYDCGNREGLFAASAARRTNVIGRAAEPVQSLAAE